MKVTRSVHVSFFRVVVRLVHQPPLDLDADTTRAVTLGGRDRNPAVSRSQIVDNVRRP
jgi:hypothetical protein